MTRSRTGRNLRRARAAKKPTVTAQDWREGYQLALREFVLSKGQPMKMEDDRFSGEPQPSYYGWTDFEILDHFTHYTASYRKHEGDPCVAFATKNTTVKERHYQQFEGTDYSGDTSHAFLVMYPVNCACGKYKNIYWAFEGSMGDVILGVVNGPE